MRPQILSSAIAIFWLSPMPLQAQTPAEFYKGRTIELDISSSVGGGYDAHARMLARHMPKHIPGNPTIVPKNVEGAGGLRLANLLYNIAPKDGSTFGIFYRSNAFEPLFGNTAAQFDATRFTWIGSASNEVSVCVSWHTSGVSTYEDMLTKELVVGASGPGADTFLFTKIINGVLGTRMRMVLGYPGSNELSLAMERGETGGRCGWSWSSLRVSHKRWVDEKKVNVLLQIALGKHPDLPDVPLVLDLAKTDEQRSVLKLIFARQVVAYPFVAPPGIPADRTAVLRNAFMATMVDKDFLADAEKANLEIRPVPGIEIESLTRDVYASPAALVQKAAALLK